MVLPLIPILMAVAAAYNTGSGLLNIKQAKSKAAEDSNRYKIAKETLLAKQSSTHESISKFQSDIQAHYSTVMSRYEPIMLTFGHAVDQLDEIPIPPGFRVVDEFQMPNISRIYSSISAPEIKALMAEGLAIGVNTVVHIMSAKMDILHSAMSAKGGRASLEMWSRGQKARTESERFSAEVDEYCSESLRVVSLFDEAISSTKNARSIFDTHVSFLNKFLTPCENLLLSGVTVTTITSEQLNQVGCLYTIGESFRKFASRALEA